MPETWNKIYVWEKFPVTYKWDRAKISFPTTQIKNVSPQQTDTSETAVAGWFLKFHSLLAKLHFRMTPVPCASRKQHWPFLLSWCYRSQWSTDRIAACDLRARKGRRLDRDADDVAGDITALSSCSALPDGLWSWRAARGKYFSSSPEGCVIPNSSSVLGRTAKPHGLMHHLLCFILMVILVCMWLLRWSSTWKVTAKAFSSWTCVGAYFDVESYKGWVGLLKNFSLSAFISIHNKPTLSSSFTSWYIFILSKKCQLLHWKQCAQHMLRCLSLVRNHSYWNPSLGPRRATSSGLYEHSLLFSKLQPLKIVWSNWPRSFLMALASDSPLRLIAFLAFMCVLSAACTAGKSWICLEQQS